MTTKRFIALCLVAFAVGAIAQVRLSNSGGIYLDSTTTATTLGVTRVLTTWTDVTLDGTNATCDLATGTAFRIYAGGAVHLLMSNVVAGASGKIKIYGDGTGRAITGAYTNVNAGALLSISVTNIARLAYDADGTADTNVNFTSVTF